MVSRRILKRNKIITAIIAFVFISSFGIIFKNTLSSKKTITNAELNEHLKNIKFDFNNENENKESTNYSINDNDINEVGNKNIKLEDIEQLINQSNIMKENEIENEEKEEKDEKNNKPNSKYYNLDKHAKGIRLNIESLILPNDEEENEEDLYENDDAVKELPKLTARLCDIDSSISPETYEGQEISCNKGYVINIDDVFFGRRPGDKETCSNDPSGYPYPESEVTVNEGEKCETHPVNGVKYLCEGKRICHVKPSGSMYGYPCPKRHYYMEIEYHCVRKDVKKDPNFAIVMFADKVKEETIYDHAISQFAQYADVHNYKFFLEQKVIDPERPIFYMKLYSVLEYVMKGLKDKSYEWVFWVDGDVTLVNPNIKLDAFIPPEDQENIHLVIADDFLGLNAGIFLIRVHPWSISFLMRACSYAFYKQDAYLPYVDQTAMYYVLTEQKEDDHYIIVPQNWFNSYYCDDDCEGKAQKGDFLVHFAGYIDKDMTSEYMKQKIMSDSEWYSRTTKEMRKTVIDYYNLPKEQQHHI